MGTFDIRSIARALGGTVTGRFSANVPGPGHSPADRSLSITIRRGRLCVHSHANDDWKACRDYISGRLGLERWSPQRRIRPRSPGSRSRKAPQDHPNVTNRLRAADVSRIMRQARGSSYEIHSPSCRNSSARPCLTYDVVGYGYVSVQALVPVSSSFQGAR